MDKSKRIQRPVYPLEIVPTLKGKQLHFDSVAEMITVRAREIPDEPYVYFYEEVVTYAQTNERANRVANYLKDKGVKKGDIVSVMILNSPEVYYPMFGAQKIGAIAGTINYMLKGPEISHVLNDSKPKVVFVGSQFMYDFAIGYEMAEHKPIVIEVNTGVEHDTNIVEQSLADILNDYPAHEALVPQKPEDPYLLLYSSGTTGKPKGILLSNKGQFSICKNMAEFGEFEPGDVILMMLPMFHTNPLCVWTYPCAYQGLTLCIRKQFSPDDFWPTVMRYGVNFASGAPALFAYIYNVADPNAIDVSKLKLRHVFTGAAPFPAELAKAFKDKFNVIISDSYGLTEGCAVASVSLNIPENRNSIGTAFHSQKVEIMDDNNNILPYGTKGEICIKGDVVMIGYLNNPEATAEAIWDGWLHTGDMGYMDEQGYLYISGRKKEMINRGGENIYPREIEIPLESHPQIAEVAVVGVPDKAIGERVKACIILKEPGSLTEQDIKDYLKDKIAKYKIPEFVEFMHTFPRNATGKVLKYILRGN